MEFEIHNFSGEFSNNVAILQLQDLSDKDRIKTYAKSLNKGSIVLLGEYVIDPFFSQYWEEIKAKILKAYVARKEYEARKKANIKKVKKTYTREEALKILDETGIIRVDSKKEQYLKDTESDLKDKKKLDFLIELSSEYKHTIIAPFIEYKNRGFYKNILILNDGQKHIYAQQRLIQYEHWNESKFFANDVSRLLKSPFMFRMNDINFGVLFGFECHFDEFWMEFKNAGVDVVLVPTANTFGSNERWKNLLVTHSFTNSCYVFRANRIGCVDAPDGSKWDFYGDSFVSLGQDIIDSLGSDEGMLCIELDMNALRQMQDSWKFR